MTVFTVHEPRPRKSETEANPDRFAFVRDGFYFWAFLLGPLWMLWRRLWLVLLGYIVVTSALQFGLWKLGVATGIKFTVGFLVALLVGFEAASLRRWTYGRRRWKNHGVVVADNVEAAERRFFDLWSQDGAPQPAYPASTAATTSSPAAARIPPSAPEVLGLFPEPQSRQ
jgi:hypothetical protein